MQLLLESNNVVCLIADHIIYGTYDDPPEEKWALYDETGHIFLYALDNEYHVETYNGELPEDICQNIGKYVYDDGVIILNPDWVTPPPSMEEQVDNLDSTVDSLMTDVIPGTTEAMQMQIDALTEAIDDLMTNVIPMLMEA